MGYIMILSKNDPILHEEGNAYLGGPVAIATINVACRSGF